MLTLEIKSEEFDDVVAATDLPVLSSKTRDVKTNSERSREVEERLVALAGFNHVNTASGKAIRRNKLTEQPRHEHRWPW